MTEIAVSTHGGQTWAEAGFLDPVRWHALRCWRFDWLTPKKPGQYTLLACAKDAGGAFQPDEHVQNYRVYVINHSHPIEVFVDDPGAPRLCRRETRSLERRKLDFYPAGVKSPRQSR